MPRILKWLAALVVAALLLTAAAAGVAYGVLKNSVAPAAGTLTMAGLAGPVEVVRDGEGVPHIFAGDQDDLYAALGFVHAQDRLWQMELLRLTGQGRLSEVFGERTFTTDVFLRTLDLFGHAQRSAAALPPDTRRALAAYARGVNAFLTRPTGWFEARLPPEFLLLRHVPEPWQPADSVLALKMMALQLSGNINQELARLSYAAQGLTSAEIEDLLPPDPDDHAPPLPEISQLYSLHRPLPVRKQAALPADHAADLAADAAADLAVDDMMGTGASNNWVVSGSRTRSGKPLLANDPHLRLTAPSVWYLAHLALQRAGEADVHLVGASLAGTPLIVLGRNDFIAWGFTNTGTDVEDVFIEKINPDNPRQYLAPEGWRTFASEPMEIRVRGAGVRSVERRSTRHGPVLPGFYRDLEATLGEGYVAALRWVALDDDDATIAAGMLHPNVHTVADYFERMRGYMVPMQSMVVADTAGNIGMIAPGRVPVRDRANTVAGRAPVPGWDAKYDWVGYLNYEDLPRVLNPPEGAIGTANARIVKPEYAHLLTLDWDAPFRQQRIQQLIIDRGEHDMDTMKAAQADVLSLADVRLQTLMIASAQAGAGVDNAMLDQLTAWDGTMRADSAEPLIFTAWVRQTVKAIYRDKLGAAFDRFFDPQATALLRLLEGRATGRDWCDDTTTTQRESCGDVLAKSLREALEELERLYGRDRSKWRWGRAHVAMGEHRPFGEVAILSFIFNVVVPSPGGAYTLNRGLMDFASDQPFANRHASSYRGIYDFTDLDRSLFMQSTGQSGNPFSPDYRAFAERWSKGQYIAIATKHAEIEKRAMGTWTLSPPTR
jgi:penicillin G amidase